MLSGDHDNKERRAVETLAQALYEQQNPGGITWAKRGSAVREPWLRRAQQQLKAASPAPAGEAQE